MNTNQTLINKERGNVLFLILIAVALFAALSYAVTQSTRSGGGSADREKSILSGAGLIQYPSALRTSVLRMVLGGADVTTLQFNPPSNIVNAALSVFSPTGGAGLFQNAPSDVMRDGAAGTWFFNIEFSVPEIGTESTPNGNDLIAFLPGVTASVCEQMNQELNINTANCIPMEGNIPELDATVGQEAEINTNMESGYTLPTTQVTLQGKGGATCRAFTGQPSGCFYAGEGLNQYVVYSVLFER